MSFVCFCDAGGRREDVNFCCEMGSCVWIGSVCECVLSILTLEKTRFHRVAFSCGSVPVRFACAGRNAFFSFSDMYQILDIESTRETLDCVMDDACCKIAVCVA